MLFQEVWSSGEDGCIVIWNCCSFSVRFPYLPFLHLYLVSFLLLLTSTQQTASLTHHSKCVRCIKALSQMVITGDVSGKLIIWDAYLRVPLQQMNFSDPIFAVLPHPSGKKYILLLNRLNVSFSLQFLLCNDYLQSMDRCGQAHS